MKPKLSETILALAVLLVIFPILSSRFHFRLDLTDGRMYSLSPYTKEVLSSLDSEVKVTWYRSQGLERSIPAVGIIGDFLGEYRAASNGWFSLSVKDTLAEGASRLADSLGMLPRQVELQQDGSSVPKDVYSGLLVEYNGSSRVIPFLADQKNLEYDLTRFILEMDDASAASPMREKRIQILYGNSQGAAQYPYVEPWLSYAGFDVSAVTLPSSGLDPERALLVIGSSMIDEATARAIADFLERNGNAAFFVSGTTVNISGDWIASPKYGDNLLPVLARNGITIEPALVLDESNWQITMPSLDNTKYEYIRYPFWVSIPESGIKGDTPVFSGTGNLQFYWPSGILLDAASDASFETILESSPSSIIMAPPFDTNPFGNQLLTVENSAGKNRARLAVTSSSRGRAVYVADEYFPSTAIEYTGSDGNLDFLVNCAEWITGYDRLLELKKGYDASLPVTERETSSIADYFRAGRIVMLIAVPMLVLALFALSLAIRRRKGAD